MPFCICCAYGNEVLPSRPTLKFRLHSPQGFLLFGPADTMFRFNNGPVKRLGDEPTFTQDHQWMPVRVSSDYSAGWPNARPEPPDMSTEGVAVYLFYPASTECAGVRGNISALSGYLPERCKKFFMLVRNELAGFGGEFAANASWATRGVTKAGLLNWATVSPRLEHVLLWNYAINTPGTLVGSDFGLSSSNALRTIMTVGNKMDLGDLPVYTGVRFPALDWIYEEARFDNGGTTSPLMVDAIAGRTQLRHGLSFPGYNLAGSNYTWAYQILQKISAAWRNGAQAAPGAQVRLGPSIPRDANTTSLEALGYSVPNENA